MNEVGQGSIVFRETQSEDGKKILAFFGLIEVDNDSRIGDNTQYILRVMEKNGVDHLVFTTDHGRILDQETKELTISQLLNTPIWIV